MLKLSKLSIYPLPEYKTVFSGDSDRISFWFYCGRVKRCFPNAAFSLLFDKLVPLFLRYFSFYKSVCKIEKNIFKFKTCFLIVFKNDIFEILGKVKMMMFYD